LRPPHIDVLWSGDLSLKCSKFALGILPLVVYTLDCLESCRHGVYQPTETMESIIDFDRSISSDQSIEQLSGIDFYSTVYRGTTDTSH
jgi:hypothetical protein